MQLTQKQRENAIDHLINCDMDGANTRKAVYNLFYYGLPAYKDFLDDEIMEYLDELELDQEEINLILNKE